MSTLVALAKEMTFGRMCDEGESLAEQMDERVEPI
jgi:hypothetical protein